MKKKLEYIMPDSPSGKAAFLANWPEVEARIKKILPLYDASGGTVTPDSLVLDVDFTGVADALKNAPDETGMIERFFAEVEKKSPDGPMTVGELLTRPAGELTRWRKMGNNLILLPNALVVHLNNAG